MRTTRSCGIVSGAVGSKAKKARFASTVTSYTSGRRVPGTPDGDAFELRAFDEVELLHAWEGEVVSGRRATEIPIVQLCTRRVGL